jgi:predicted kinase
MASTGRLIIVCGLPGSGKTTYARTLEEREHGIRFSPGEWMAALAVNLREEQVRSRIEALQWHFCQQLLTHGLTTIIEWGTWGKWERDVLRTRARELGATVELHYLFAPAEVLFKRIQKRGMGDPPIKREEVNRWFEIFEVPTTEEMALFDAVELCEGRSTQ